MVLQMKCRLQKEYFSVNGWQWHWNQSKFGVWMSSPYFMLISQCHRQGITSVSITFDRLCRSITFDRLCRKVAVTTGTRLHACIGWLAARWHDSATIRILEVVLGASAVTFQISKAILTSFLLSEETKYCKGWANSWIVTFLAELYVHANLHPNIWTTLQSLLLLSSSWLSSKRNVAEHSKQWSGNQSVKWRSSSYRFPSFEGVRYVRFQVNPARFDPQHW